MPSRDRGRARARASDEEFVLFLQGVSTDQTSQFSQMACLTEKADPSPLPLARAQRHGTPDSPAYPTGGRIRRPARVSNWFGANHREERR